MSLPEIIRALTDEDDVGLMGRRVALGELMDTLLRQAEPITVPDLPPAIIHALALANAFAGGGPGGGGALSRSSSGAGAGGAGGDGTGAGASTGTTTTSTSATTSGAARANSGGGGAAVDDYEATLLAGEVQSLAVRALVQLLELDESARRGLARPGALAVLVATLRSPAGAVEVVPDLMKLVTAVGAAYPSSFARSGGLAAGFAAFDLLPLDPRRRFLAAVVGVAEASVTREDAAAILSIMPSCVRLAAAAPTLARGAPPAPTDGLCVDAALRVITRFLTMHMEVAAALIAQWQARRVGSAGGTSVSVGGGGGVVPPVAATHAADAAPDTAAATTTTAASAAADAAVLAAVDATAPVLRPSTVAAEEAAASNRELPLPVWPLQTVRAVVTTGALPPLLAALATHVYNAYGVAVEGFTPAAATTATAASNSGGRGAPLRRAPSESRMMGGGGGGAAVLATTLILPPHTLQMCVRTLTRILLLLPSVVCLPDAAADRGAGGGAAAGGGGGTWPMAVRLQYGALVATVAALTAGLTSAASSNGGGDAGGGDDATRAVLEDCLTLAQATFSLAHHLPRPQ